MINRSGRAVAVQRLGDGSGVRIRLDPTAYPRRNEGSQSQGRLRGEQSKLKPNQAKHLLELHDPGTYTQAELADLFGVGRSMIHRTIDRLRALTGEGCTGGTAVGRGQLVANKTASGSDECSSKLGGGMAKTRRILPVPEDRMRYLRRRARFGPGPAPHSDRQTPKAPYGRSETAQLLR